MAVKKKSAQKINEKALFGSPYTKERFLDFEKKAKDDAVFMALLEEYQSIFNDTTIKGILVLQDQLTFMEGKLKEAKDVLPGFVNESAGKKRSSKKDEGEQDEQESYDIKAWDRYDKILALYTKTLSSSEALKKTLTKADMEEVDSRRSYIGMANKI